MVVFLLFLYTLRRKPATLRDSGTGSPSQRSVTRGALACAWTSATRRASRSGCTGARCAPCACVCCGCMRADEASGERARGCMRKTRPPLTRLASVFLVPRGGGGSTQTYVSLLGSASRKNVGAISANHLGSTAKTSRMYSFVVSTSSW